MSDQLKISIVTPSYSQAEFLEETIQSVLNQDYPNLEYVIIDGGSTDSSVDIIKKYEKKLSYWVSEKDKGQSDAINKGFRRASGEILAWLNSDDCYLPGTLERVADFFSSHATVDLVYGDLLLIDGRGKTVGIRRVVPYNYTLALYGLSSVPQPSAFFRRRALNVVGLLDEEFHYQMDAEFFLRFGKMGLNIKYLPVPLAMFRFHAQSKTVSEYHDKVQQANRRILEKILGRTITEGEAWKFQVFKQMARFAIYLQRIVLRFDFLPFRAKISMKRAGH